MGIIKIGHPGTCLIAKNNGRIGKKTDNNKGVSQGSPVSAFLFIIYDGQRWETMKRSKTGNWGGLRIIQL